jgi:hypothetical protein
VTVSQPAAVAEPGSWTVEKGVLACLSKARMAKPVDAADLKSAAPWGVQVRVLLRAPRGEIYSISPLRRPAGVCFCLGVVAGPPWLAGWGGWQCGWARVRVLLRAPRGGIYSISPLRRLAGVCFCLGVVVGPLLKGQSVRRGQDRFLVGFGSRVPIQSYAFSNHEPSSSVSLSRSSGMER